MTDAQTVDRDQLAADFRDAFSEKLPPAALDAALTHLESRPLIAGSNSPAKLSLSGSINTRVTCAVLNGPTFLGHIWGSVAGVADQGYIYTDDSERLYSQTTTFALIMTSVYVSMLFMDDAGNALGSFQGGALGLVSGNFGGTGSWS